MRELNKLYNDYVRAVQEATNYCIANGILADFLKEQGGRIVSILAAEFDLDVAKRVWADERALEIAENMLKKGYTVTAISEVTGLHEEEVSQLQNTRVPIHLDRFDETT